MKVKKCLNSIILMILISAGIGAEDLWSPINNPVKIKAGNMGGLNTWDIVWTGSELTIIGENGARYNPTTNTWKKMAACPLDAGTVGVYNAIWTGNEIIVFGAKKSLTSSAKNFGARYDPQKDEWKEISSPPFEPRLGSNIVWTGKELIVWGGVVGGINPLNWIYKNDGGRYDPITDTWKLLPPAPILGRGGSKAIWTGNRMIVFGGLRFISSINAQELLDGACYNPETDSWKQVSRPTSFNPLIMKSSGGESFSSTRNMVWTGKELVVLGAQLVNNSWECAKYNPETDTWTSFTPPPIKPRSGFVTLWTGTDIIIWGGGISLTSGFGGGFALFFDGAHYNTITNSWIVIPPSNRSIGHSYEIDAFGNSSDAALGAILELQQLKRIMILMFRNSHAVWTGKEMLTFDGKYTF